MRALRRSRTEAQRQIASRAVVQRLGTMDCVRDAQVIGIYWALPRELVLWPGLPTPVIALPVMQGRDQPLLFRRLVHEKTLVRAAFNVMQPPPDAAPVALSRIDVLVMPGLAVDLAGNRLGYGGGYYDRTLMGLRTDTITVMVALDEQVVDAVPSEPTDVRVRAVVTPSGCRWFNKGDQRG
ncbi:MAG: 5-formyltetrahydrofolate cyclo-ligase [Kiritimatiellia bacterium]|jgi:5-formyltetrahydrofolate cyclo-ligase